MSNLKIKISLTTIKFKIQIGNIYILSQRRPQFQVEL